MLSSFVPIVAQAPIYPQSHIDLMLQRVKTLFPEMGEDAATMFLCDLFNITNLSEMLDKDGVQDKYEFQPAISTQELDLLAARVLPYFEPLLSDFDRKELVRGVINCVPKTLDDLVDYMHPQDIATINDVFMQSCGLVDRPGQETVQVVRVRPELMTGTDKDAVEIAGSVVMTMQNNKGAPKDDAMPERQNILRRAGEFYLLHLYRYPVASLWLAKYINPLTFCHCPNVSCEGRAFGFADAHAMVRLVLSNLAYIEELFERDEKRMTADEGMSVSDIKNDYIALFMDTAEVLMIIDQEREHSLEVRDLLGFIANRKDAVPPIEYCRALVLSSIAWNLYEDDNPVPRLFFNEVKAQSQALEHISILAFDQFAATVKERPADKYLYLFDAHNFFAHGHNWVSPGYGMSLRATFLLSLFDSEYMDHFMAEAETITEDPDAPAGLKELVIGYQKNLMGVIAKRGFSLPEVLPGASRHVTDPAVIKELADMAWPTGIERYLEDSGRALSERATKYWEDRLEIANGFVPMSV